MFTKPQFPVDYYEDGDDDNESENWDVYIIIVLNTEQLCKRKRRTVEMRKRDYGEKEMRGGWMDGKCLTDPSSPSFLHSSVGTTVSFLVVSFLKSLVRGT